MSTLTLYTHPWSRGRIARWMLEETGAHYSVEIMEFGGSIKSAEYLALNPMGKVPAIKHVDTVVTEVAAICLYLADQFPQANLAPPPQSPERGTYYRWILFAAGPLEMAMSAVAYNWRIDKDNAEAVGCGFVADTVNTLEKALSKGPYICGEQFTGADVLLASYIGWEITQKNLEPRPVFIDYVKRCEARPAHIRATELDDALAPA